jgi:hypothetical protein
VALASGGGAHAHRAPAPCRAPRNNPWRYPAHDGNDEDEVSDDDGNESDESDPGYVKPRGGQAGGWGLLLTSKLSTLIDGPVRESV